jgi:hypothetical protein
MQSADTVLGVLRERGKRKLPLERLYRQLFNEQLFLMAYGRIYANTGAMTPRNLSSQVRQRVVRGSVSVAGVR